ncbi:VCBS repeat-containing protein [uncultured Oscillibacter sp.]|uniref:FG-GAP repeat domain-containing protein n=2 Tax=uncultured Oscillibacter sp. TaxID=876091 RepID=UPI00260377B0|nr:VCBS repeat-containing protein [uncultured Oscillibacter sp.]
MMRRRIRALAAALLLAAALSGCGGFNIEFNPEELYALPELPAKYTELNAQLNAILEDGAEYAAPAAGTNIQPVQLTDLDGDGQQEAVAFFRKAEDEKPLKIYIFSAKGDRYEQSAVIEGSGASVYSVVYSDLDGDGRTELIVGWRVNAELQALSVYALDPAGPQELLRSVSYVRYASVDLDGDGLQELVVFHVGEEGGGVADYYDWQEGGTLQSVSSARLSVTMAELNQGRVVSGTLRDGLPAVFATGVTTPVSTELAAAAVTDILAAPEQELVNAALSSTTGVTSAVNAFRGLYPTDINGDGAIEVPSPAAAPRGGESDQRVDWKSYNGAGEETVVLRTYHNMEDGWYLQLPESWTGRVEAERSSTGSDTSVTFYVLDEMGIRKAAILRITALTGTGREVRATRGNRFPLSRQSDVIYTAELPETPPWDQAMTAEEVRGAFNLIAREWIPGDN